MRARMACTTLVIVMVTVMTLPGPAVAMERDQIHLRGLLDLTAAGGDALTLNAFNAGDSNFDPYRLRLFLDAEFDGGFEAHVQTIAIGQEHGLQQYGAYALWTPRPDRDLHLEAGLIPWPIGTWAPRTYSNKNGLVGTPMLYQLHGSLSFVELPPSTDALLAAAGSGESGVDYGTGAHSRGVPILYDRCWDVGAIAIGATRPFEFAFGLVQGAPSWPQTGRDGSDGKSMLGRVGVVVGPAVRLGVSASRGPWLPSAFDAGLPDGASTGDMDQLILIIDAEFQQGAFEFRGESYVNEWEVPRIGRLDVRGAWAEGKVSVAPGLWLALRGEVMRHSPLTSSTGLRRPWDNDRERWESGAGLRITRDASIKLAWQRNLEHVPNSAGRTDDLIAATLSLGF